MLPGGNALLITYPLHDGVDLRRWGGPENATVLDGEIQELDPQGHLVWAWNTTSHVALAESAHWLRPRTFQSAPLVVDGRPTYDIVHMNSIEPFGNRLVFSARYLDGVYEIDRTTGHILWKLGGTKTRKSLTIVGDPLVAKDFGGQHDARILDGGRILTLYNNAKGRDLPRALEFRIDAKAGTATLIQTIRFPRAGPSRCCGSARKLPGGDWVISWSETPWVTEQTASGRPVLTLEFAPGISSYRAEPILPGRVSLEALRRGMDAMAP